jgi:hypothetical protein
MKDAQPRWIILDEWSVTVEYVESVVNSGPGRCAPRGGHRRPLPVGASLQDAGHGAYKVKVSRSPVAG